MSEPMLQAILIAEGHAFDMRSARFSLFNVFNAIVAPEVPTWFPRFSVYAKVADVSGEIRGKFQILDPNLALVYETMEDGGLSRADETHEFGGCVAALPCSKIGDYCVQFVCNGRVLGTTRLRVYPMPTLSAGE